MLVGVSEIGAAILAPVLVFGLVIFVHELGHFLAAKAVGVYAPRFSIGFGPALWRRRRGETEYVLALFPIGGYVRMASRHDEASAMLEGGSEESSRLSAKDPGYDPDAMMPFGPKPVPEDRWFESQSLPARLFILLSGVTMNVVLALVVSIGLAFQAGRVTVPTRVVGAVRVPAGAPALTGLQPGDTILRVNGESVAAWHEIVRAVARSKDRVTFTTSRGPVVVPIGDRTTALDIALALDYRVLPVLDTIMPGEPAARAGLLRGDSIAAINGVPVPGFAELTQKVNASADSPLVLTVFRRGAPLDVRVTPRRHATTNPQTKAPMIVGRIGVMPRTLAVRRPIGVGEAIAGGTRVTWEMATSIGAVVRGLVTQRVSVKQLGGPIAIMGASVDAARSGAETLFLLIALLSVNVAILNLLPIPILDGGQIVINVIETMKGSPFSLRTRENILRFGLVAIGLLFAVVMWNDTREWSARVFSWVGRLFQ